MSFNECLFGKYPNDWNLSNLGDLISVITDYHANGSYKKLKENVELKDDEDYAVMIRTTNFEQGAFNNSDFKYISKDAYEFLSKTKVYENDLLMNKIANAGSVYRMPRINKPVSLAMNLFLIRANEEKLNNVYMYYFLKNYEAYVKMYAEGSVTKTITKDNVRKLKIAYPEIDEQNAICNVLEKIEKKVDMNNKINQRLEEMAQSIFKHWFVNFEFPNEEGKPYKSSGGEMIESELGMIPKGWEVGVFRNYITDILGGDWGKETPQGNYIKDVYCVRGADIPEINKGNKGKSPVRYILEKNFNNKKLTDGDLIVEISGGSPTQSTGRISYINKPILEKFDKGLVCTNFCRAITLKDRKLMEFVYVYWSYLYDLDVFFQFENGTTGIKNFDINNFLDRNEIIYPPKTLIDKYHDVVKSIFIMIQKNGKENEKLSNLRDTLLPKLMSGEIRVQTNK
ncbi:MAG: restriction endonuclease subunit S [Terrisporobacter othiniensis]|uniref:restriction endonuclease subunit S n=1 Tax=Terrisporobacter othiniensis TaxID=1577792 RepID=UPI0029065BEA|nr:restriction endonuclease subunit S [Terrisporobacter othiniensis]MDU6983956.1 restriction endonuclease subunit S [Terrisporobacter othiniensis]